jgi:hypothetical protein
LENHVGADLRLMDECVEIAAQAGLQNAYWSGHAGIAGKIEKIGVEIELNYRLKETQLAGSYAHYAGCRTHPRNCCSCSSNQTCNLKKYIPGRST